jgi:DNA-binding NarL/FixJ family response regulator
LIRLPQIEKITVLLVDDHSLVRRGFRRILEDEARIAVVGEAGNGHDAIQLTREIRPRVVLMDCAMPDMNGIVATRAILKACPETLVVMLSMHTEGTWIRQAVKAGARGFIVKNAIALDLSATIERVAAGELLFDDPGLSKPAVAGGKRDLTTRELQVLQLIVDGKSNREIATELTLSVNTVGAHRARIMTATGIRKTADLVVYAIRNGLVNIS